jgi:cobalt/nickel transport system ATP-binding protein
MRRRASVLQEVDFALLSGQRVGLFGPNGCGKTTLLSILTGLLPARNGRSALHGPPMRTEADFMELRRGVGLLLQNARDDQLLFPHRAGRCGLRPAQPGPFARRSRQRGQLAWIFVGLSGFGTGLRTDSPGGRKSW